MLSEIKRELIQLWSLDQHWDISSALAEMQNPQLSQTYWINVCILIRPPPTLGVLYVPWSLRNSVLDCFSHSQGHLNYLCAHVSGCISSPNYSVKCPSWQSLLSQPALVWLDLQTSRAQGEACSISFIFSGSRLKWESGGRERSLLFDSCAGVYCSSGRFHLVVHTPRSFLAGSAFFENQNKEIMIH